MRRRSGQAKRASPSSRRLCEGAMARALVLVMDSVGIGGAPDAAAYGDAGANTILHIADGGAGGEGDAARRHGPLRVPNLVALGLGEACRLAAGQVPPGLETAA